MLFHYTQYIKHSQVIKYVSVCVVDVKETEMMNLISYEPLFETMQKKGITEYNLIYKQGMSANTIHRIKKGLPFTTETLDTLCFILDCEVSDILRHDKTR